ncbi:ragulator complex protein LAMTOR1 [Onychostruthus taczanowskii]|uniref:ragulator complex protein LAMTOR1 n=1 Tax=Onychostruthus taczanowskii TaxID=356909 RepID=UPI001B801AD0|nr:ragulator complex protein LAMTOR1 [Onychostruthus taczanowskii]
MEQHEYMDRARQYSTRLAMLSNNLTHWKKLPLLPSLTNQPHQVLASDPVPFADLQQVSRAGLSPEPLPCSPETYPHPGGAVMPRALT